MRTKYDPILFDDASVSSVPSDKTQYINLVTARSDYKNRKARDDAAKASKQVIPLRYSHVHRKEITKR